MRKILLAVVLGTILIGSSFVYADGRSSVAAGAGGAWPEGMDGTWYFTAAYRWHFEDNWAIEPDLGYWKQDEAEEDCFDRGCVLYSLSDFHLGTNLLYTGSAWGLSLYTGGGVAAHWRDREIVRNVEPFPQPNPEPDKTRFGLQILFGADIPVASKVDITVALRNDWIFREDEVGDQSVAKLYAGLRFYF